MDEQVQVRVRQREIEQVAVDAMYDRLDEEAEAMSAARDRALAAGAEDAGDRYAREVEVARLGEGVRRLRAAERSLCFGRIDRAGDDEPLHVGRVGVRTDAGRSLLVDWRAEAAAPFYAATTAAPMGVRRRRHLRLDGRRVVGLTDEILDGTSPRPGDLVGDGPLVAALSSARTGRMREAAATLQAEQDRIVRSPHTGVLVVDGGPGTGKTIVALHRAAYVLYAFPEIAGRGVLVFGPNRRFLAYISEVLPSLGENDVQLATTGDLVGAEVSVEEPDDLARRKGRAVMAERLAAWVRRHQPAGVPLELRVGEETVVLAADLVDAARSQALEGDIGHNRARGRFLESVVDHLVHELEERSVREHAAYEEELQALLGLDLDRFTGATGPSDDDLGIDWDAVREDLLEDPALDRAITRVWPPLRASDVVRGLLADEGAPAQGWSAADLALLDEARALVDGLPEQTYGHVVVDEAQQLSEMQWRMLFRRCPGRSMTVVGDLAQAGPTTTVRTWADALDPFVAGRHVHHRLTVNYRTTAEILQASEELLSRIAPDQRLSRSIRHGEQPRALHVPAGDVDRVLQDLLRELRQHHPGELVGVIATAERARALAGRVRDATLVAAPEARGLEFDTVVLLDPEGIQDSGTAGARDLYVARTRPTKRLVSVHLAGPSVGSP